MSSSDPSVEPVAVVNSALANDRSIIAE
jgi:hypothetical protein